MVTKPSRRSLRGRVLAAALIPSVALLLVGVVLSGYQIYDAAQGRDFVVRVHDAAQPGVDFFGAIREERRLTLQSIAGSGVGGQLADQRSDTDAAARELMSHVDGMVDGASDEIRGVIDRLRGQLDELSRFRGQLDQGANAPTLQEAYELYNRIIDTVASGLTGVARLTPDAETSYLRTMSMPLFTAADDMARADALAAAGHAAGGLSDEEFEAYVGAVGAYRSQLERTSMIPSVRAKYDELRSGDAWRVVRSVEDAFLDGDGTQQIPVTPDRWHAAASEVGGTLMSLYIEQSTHATNEGVARADRTLTGAIVAGGVAVGVGSLLIFFAWRLASWLVTRLVRLREETLDLADHRLPELVGRVRGGEQVDAVELESADHGADEIGQVADAFTKAQRTALAAAIEESKVREGTRTVFLNIAHRSQVLVHRQLKALDDAERGMDDPQQLETLFRLDHLATRARRNAENLIILGGQQPRRRWRNPVSVSDLVRGATAEIEHYRRVDLAGLPEVAVIGPAVGDTVHLLAELFDNATAFSPPDARVLVRGEAAEGRGVVIEIEDQGLGIEPDDAERLNALLAEPPDFSFMALSDEPRLGLFVVARLAARHGIQVRLREAIHGGTRVVVRLGPELVASRGDPGESGESGGVPDAAAVVPEAAGAAPDTAAAPDIETASDTAAGELPSDPAASDGAASDGAGSDGADVAWPTAEPPEDAPASDVRAADPPRRHRHPATPDEPRRAGSVGEALAGGDVDGAESGGESPEIPRRRPQAPQTPQDPSGANAGMSDRAQAQRPAPERPVPTPRPGRTPQPQTPPRPRRPPQSGPHESEPHRPGAQPSGARESYAQQSGVQGSGSEQSGLDRPEFGESGSSRSGPGDAVSPARPPLPRRRKQENLAPQLRQAPPDRGEPGPEAGAREPHLNAEAARNRFAGFQRGTQRARNDQGRRDARDGRGLFADGEGPQ